LLGFTDLSEGELGLYDTTPLTGILITLIVINIEQSRSDADVISSPALTIMSADIASLASSTALLQGLFTSEISGLSDRVLSLEQMPTWKFSHSANTISSYSS
jgi:hypothetical protein